MPVYQDPEKKTWYCKFRYTDWTGKSRHTTKRGFRTKREAKEYEHGFKAKAATSPDIAMETLCKQYLEYIEARFRKSTWVSKERHVRLNIIPCIGSVKAKDITRNTIAKWQEWLLSRKLSPSTVYLANTILRSVLNYAVRMEILARNPANEVPKVGQKGKREAFLELADYKRLVAAGEGEKGFHVRRLCLDILFYSGLRISEFLALGKDSFDFSRNLVLVRAGMDKEGAIIPLKTKESRRDIPMPPSIMERVREHMESLDDIPEHNLFMVSYSSLKDVMRKWAAKAGVPCVGLHGLRHSHVSYLISLGVPITVISKRIGHKSPDVTLAVYSHMYHEDASSVAELLESGIVGQSLVKGENRTAGSL